MKTFFDVASAIIGGLFITAIILLEIKSQKMKS